MPTPLPLRERDARLGVVICSGVGEGFSSRAQFHPSPTLAQFERLVAEGKIHYFIAGGVFGGPGGGSSSTSSAIASWVESHFTSTTVGGVTLYDLTSPTS